MPIPDDDISQPFTLETRRPGRQIIYVPQVASTNDLARAMAREGAVEGTVVITDDQPGGRGRFGRPWVVPPGSSLMLSMILWPEIDSLRQLPMLAGLAASEAIEAVTGLPIRLKWPNDIVAGTGAGKIGGILVETEISGSSAFAVVGIGLNVNFDPNSTPGFPPTGTTLSAVLGYPVPRRRLLAALLERADLLYERVQAGESLVEPWAAQLATIGQQVRLASADRIYEGRAIGVNADGRLILEGDHGILAFAAGEVTSQLPA